jgi:hypothetical protein
MPKYEVTVNETISHTIRVWAEDTDQAIKLGREVIINGDGRDTFTESLGLDQEASWVEEIKGDD